MANSVNCVTLIGRVGKDPEARDVGQSIVCEFSLATSEKWKDKEGNTQERTEWHRITCWGKLAEIARDFVRKGSQVYIQGAIRTEKYEKDGVEKTSLKIVADKLVLLGARPEQASDPVYAPPAPRQTPQAATRAAPQARQISSYSSTRQAPQRVQPQARMADIPYGNDARAPYNDNLPF